MRRQSSVGMRVGNGHGASVKVVAEEEEGGRVVSCGLCHTLARGYGAVCRMVLNSDFTFLASLLSGTIGTENRRCIAGPFKKRPVACENPALDLAADVSILFTYWKLRDGAADRRGVR